MNKKILMAVAIAGMTLSLPAWSAGNGLVIKKSPYSAVKTLDRWEQILKQKHIRVFARISHKQNAAGVGLKLRPTELLIFGNPKLGTYFFMSNQTAGIDLPMKAMAWEDAKGQTWVAYNDPQYIADRHDITDRADIIKKMKGALEKFSDYAIAK
ncbi:MAG: DUF302 domain-containing protein [Acidiferrobacterales bacterium]